MTIRWGFLGAGYVASRAMAPAVHRAQGAQLLAVASRDDERSRSLEPVTTFDSYAQLVESPQIDAVYVSLTNSQHRQWVVAALDAGKHVLCEKPLGVSADDVDSMAHAAQRNNVLLVEAVWVRWHPRHQRFAEIVRSGDLGDDVHLASSFTFTSDMSDNYRLRPEMGGGALLDVGGYQVHSWLAAFGGDVEVDVTHVERFVGPTGVDLTTRASARVHAGFLGDASTEMECSFIEPQGQVLAAQGTRARLEMLEGEAFTSWREPSSLRLGDTIERFPDCDAFVLMVEQVSRHFSGIEDAHFEFEESRRAARIVDEIADRVQI